MESATEKPTADPPSPKLSLPFKTRISLSLLTFFTSASRRRDGTVNRRFLSFFDVRSPPSTTPINSVSTHDVAVDPSRNLWFRVFVPAENASAAATTPVIVFFHGGGFVYLSADAKVYDAVCRRIARKVGAVVVSVNYRLAPEFKYPAQVEDAFDVLKFLEKDGVDGKRVLPGNADLSRCFLAGDSAGGNLAHFTAKRASESGFRRVKVVGLIAIQPFFGGEERTEAELNPRLKGTPIVSVEGTDWAWDMYFPPGEGFNRDHEAVNVSGPNAADLSSLEFPATIVFVGGFDMLQDWQRRYYRWLKSCGKEAYLVEYPNMFHAFYIFPELPESGKLIQEVKEFVQKHSKW